MSVFYVHIDIKYHFIRDHVEKNDIILEYVSTEHQLAYIFTKALCEKRFSQLRLELGMIEMSWMVKAYRLIFNFFTIPHVKSGYINFKVSWSYGKRQALNGHSRRCHVTKRYLFFAINRVILLKGKHTTLRVFYSLSQWIPRRAKTF